eukprot:364989-Chlamydomonas_euryale.AAC.1
MPPLVPPMPPPTPPQRGEAKNTYGTGAFLMLHTGEHIVPSNHGLLTTVAYRLVSVALSMVAFACRADGHQLQPPLSPCDHFQATLLPPAHILSRRLATAPLAYAEHPPGLNAGLPRACHLHTHTHTHTHTCTCTCTSPSCSPPHTHTHTTASRTHTHHCPPPHTLTTVPHTHTTAPPHTHTTATVPPACAGHRCHHTVLPRGRHLHRWSRRVVAHRQPQLRRGPQGAGEAVSRGARGGEGGDGDGISRCLVCRLNVKWRRMKWRRIANTNSGYVRGVRSGGWARFEAPWVEGGSG